MQPTSWWQTGVIYQIYPRSFQDSNGDGLGDLRGIIQRLPYLAEFGVDAIWISPIFVSPMADFGYDIADYTDIDPLFGNLKDFDELLAAAHQLRLKIILDLVPNHTSDQHPWFIESRASRDNPKRDWYIWHDPARDGGPPHHAVIPLYTADRPEVHDIIAGMRRIVNEFPERVLIGEIYLPVERLVAYYGRDLSGVHLPFNFALLSAPWRARHLAKLIEEYEAALPSGGWPNWVLGNHDKPRIASRIGLDQARVAAMLLLTLRGTPTIYYGEEIGMEQVPIAPEDVRDPFEKRVPGQGLGRDGCRTPMQWDDSRYAGLSTNKPWLPLAENAVVENVAQQQADANSNPHPTPKPSA